MTWADILGVCLSSAAFAAKADEYQHEARRCRRIVRGVLENADTNGCVMEFYTEKRINKHKDPGLGMVICAPGLTEENLGPACQMAIQEWFAGAGDSTVVKIGKDRHHRHRGGQAMTKLLDEAALVELATKLDDWAYLEVGDCTTLIDNIRRLKEALSIARQWMWPLPMHGLEKRYQDDTLRIHELVLGDSE